MIGIFNSKQTHRRLSFTPRKIIRTISDRKKIVIFRVPANSSHIILLIRPVNESPQRMKQFRALLLALFEQIFVLLVLLSLIILHYHSFHDFQRLIKGLFLLFLVQIQFFESVVFMLLTILHVFLVNVVLVDCTAKIESLGLSSPDPDFPNHLLPRLNPDLRVIELISQNTKGRSDTFFLLLFAFSELFSDIVVFKDLIDFFVSLLLQFFLYFVLIGIFDDLIAIVLEMNGHLRDHFVYHYFSGHFIIV